MYVGNENESDTIKRLWSCMCHDGEAMMGEVYQQRMLFLGINRDSVVLALRFVRHLGAAGIAHMSSIVKQDAPELYAMAAEPNIRAALDLVDPECMTVEPAKRQLETCRWFPRRAKFGWKLFRQVDVQKRGEHWEMPPKHVILSSLHAAWVLKGGLIKTGDLGKIHTGTRDFVYDQGCRPRIETEPGVVQDATRPWVLQDDLRIISMCENEGNMGPSAPLMRLFASGHPFRFVASQPSKRTLQPAALRPV
jgi:hypothetical protein